MNRFRLPALAALWLQVAAVFVVAAYALWHDNFGVSGWLGGLEAFAAGLLLTWWTLVFARITGPHPPAAVAAPRSPWEEDAAQQGAVQQGAVQHGAVQNGAAQLGRGLSEIQRDGIWRSLLLIYPWLTAYRFCLWAMTLLGLLAGVAPTANPVAVTAMLTIWGGAIWASNATNAGLLRLAAEPENPEARQQLLDWLNLAAALSLAMAVMNVVPITGYGDPPALTSQLVYGIEGLIDVAATLLAFFALQPQQQSQIKE